MNKLPPSAAALLALVLGAALAIGGVYVLAGSGWAMLAASVPCFGLAGAILRGVRHVE
jgi:hypothetical protein